MRSILIMLALLAQAPNPSDYPKVIQKNGETCVQTLAASGEVQETCKPKGAGWESATPTTSPDAPRIETPALARSARLLPSPHLSVEVALGLRSAMAKQAWSAVLIWSGVGALLAGTLFALQWEALPPGSTFEAGPMIAAFSLGGAFVATGIVLQAVAWGQITDLVGAGTSPPAR